jgi:hypothetical protein
MARTQPPLCAVSPILLRSARAMQIGIFCVVARRRGQPDGDCVAGLVRFGFAVTDLLDLPVVAVEPYRGEGAQVIKRATVGFVFEDVRNTAEVIGSVCGILPGRAAEGDVKDNVPVIGRGEGLGGASLPGGLQEKPDSRP